MKKSMKKIVLSAIAALVLTVGVYHAALLIGASEPALAAALVLTLAALAFTTFAVVFAAVAAFAAAVVALAFTTFAVVGAIAIAIAVITFVIAVVAEQEHIRFRWVVSAYGVEGMAICGALAVVNPGWSVAIAFGGIVALLVLWRLAPKQTAVSAAASALPDGNGA